MMNEEKLHVENDPTQRVYCCFSFSVFQCVAGRFYWVRGGAKSHDGEKAWHSTENSILSGPNRTEGNTGNREDLERLCTVKKERMLEDWVRRMREAGKG